MTEHLDGIASIAFGFKVLDMGMVLYSARSVMDEYNASPTIPSRLTVSDEFGYLAQRSV